MVNEKEIRIGNIFQFKGKWSANYQTNEVFKWDDMDWYSLGASTMFIEDVHPVSLSEAFLSRFKYLGNDYYQVADNSKVQYFDSNWFVLVDFQGLEVCVKKIKYIHQLQNIVYDLTGEEI